MEQFILNPQFLNNLTLGTAFFVITVFLLKYFMSQQTQDRQDLVKEIRWLKMYIGRSVLEDTQIVQVTKNAMRRQSRDKLKYLRDILVVNNIQARMERIKYNIKAEFERQTWYYVTTLNQYPTRLGLAGRYIKDNFPMEQFLNDVYAIFFEDKKYTTEQEREVIINRKINDIEQLMLSYQENFCDNFLKELWKW